MILFFALLMFSSTTKAIRLTVCYGKWLNIRCPANHLTVFLGATYGRSDLTTCSTSVAQGPPGSSAPAMDAPYDGCSDPATLRTLIEMCDERRNCLVEVNDLLFSVDSCSQADHVINVSDPALKNYLRVSYRCEPATSITEMCGLQQRIQPASRGYVTNANFPAYPTTYGPCALHLIPPHGQFIQLKFIVLDLPTTSTPNCENKVQFKIGNDNRTLCKRAQSKLNKRFSSVNTTISTTGVKVNFMIFYEAVGCKTSDLNKVLPAHSKTMATAYGQKVRFNCSKGYLLSDHASTHSATYAEILCVNSKWRPSKYECRQVDCGTPPTFAYAFPEYRSTTYGARIYYNCLGDKPMVNPTKFQCSIEGIWRGVPPKCPGANVSKTIPILNVGKPKKITLIFNLFTPGTLAAVVLGSVLLIVLLVWGTTCLFKTRRTQKRREACRAIVASTAEKPTVDLYSPSPTSAAGDNWKGAPSRAFPVEPPPISMDPHQPVINPKLHVRIKVDDADMANGGSYEMVPLQNTHKLYRS